MSEEEKAILEDVKKHLNTIVWFEKSIVEDLVNIIEKQQKKIKGLELKNIGLYGGFTSDNFIESSDYISKDKIREKIKEIEELDKKYKHFMSDGREEFVIETVAIPILKELLGDE